MKLTKIADDNYLATDTIAGRIGYGRGKTPEEAKQNLANLMAEMAAKHNAKKKPGRRQASRKRIVEKLVLMRDKAEEYIKQGQNVEYNTALATWADNKLKEIEEKSASNSK